MPTIFSEIIPNVVKVFIYADIESRIKRAVDRREIDPARAKQAVIKADKNRANYYSFYSGQKWGQADNFDLCINTTKLSTDQAVELISKYLDYHRMRHILSSPEYTVLLNLYIRR